MKIIRSLLRSQKGATAIEYGLIASLIAVAAIAAMNGLGGAISGTFQDTSSTLASN